MNKKLSLRQNYLEVVPQGQHKETVVQRGPKLHLNLAAELGILSEIPKWHQFCWHENSRIEVAIKSI